MPNSQFQSSYIIKTRAGTSDDPFVSISEDFTVVNGKVLLSEIPDQYYGISANQGSTQLIENKKGSTLSSNSFYVDYRVGLIYLHSSLDNKSVRFNYKGRGQVFFSSGRIFTKERSGNVLETLDETIENSKSYIEWYKEETKKDVTNFKRLAEVSIETERKNSIKALQDKSNDLTAQTSKIVNDSQAALNRANLVTGLAETTIQNATSAANEANTQANFSKKQGEFAKATAEQINNETLVIYKNPVSTYSQLNTTYPNPQNGWTAIALDTKNKFRYSASLNKWVHFDSIPDSGLIIGSDSPLSTSVLWVDTNE